MSILVGVWPESLLQQLLVGQTFGSRPMRVSALTEQWAELRLRRCSDLESDLVGVFRAPLAFLGDRRGHVRGGRARGRSQSRGRQGLSPRAQRANWAGAIWFSPSSFSAGSPSGLFIYGLLSPRAGRMQADKSLG